MLLILSVMMTVSTPSWEFSAWLGFDGTDNLVIEGFQTSSDCVKRGKRLDKQMLDSGALTDSQSEYLWTCRELIIHLPEYR